MAAALCQQNNKRGVKGIIYPVVLSCYHYYYCQDWKQTFKLNEGYESKIYDINIRVSEKKTSPSVCPNRIAR